MQSYIKNRAVAYSCLEDLKTDPMTAWACTPGWDRDRFFWFYLVLSSAFPEQKMARKNVSANQNGEGGGKWEW